MALARTAVCSAQAVGLECCVALLSLPDGRIARFEIQVPSLRNVRVIEGNGRPVLYGQIRAGESEQMIAIGDWINEPSPEPIRQNTPQTVE